MQSQLNSRFILGENVALWRTRNITFTYSLVEDEVILEHHH